MDSLRAGQGNPEILCGAEDEGDVEMLVAANDNPLGARSLWSIARSPVTQIGGPADTPNHPRVVNSRIHLSPRPRLDPPAPDFVIATARKFSLPARPSTTDAYFPPVMPTTVAPSESSSAAYLSLSVSSSSATHRLSPSSACRSYKPLSPESPPMSLLHHGPCHLQQHSICHPSPHIGPLNINHSTEGAGLPFCSSSPREKKPATPPLSPHFPLNPLKSATRQQHDLSSYLSSVTSLPPPVRVSAPVIMSTSTLCCASMARPLSPSLLDDHSLNSLFTSRYELISSLGAGGYGLVCVAWDLRNSREVAVKFILRDKVPPRSWVECGGPIEDGDGLSVGMPVPVECEILRKVRHWGIVKCEGVYADERFFYLVRVCLLL